MSELTAVVRGALSARPELEDVLVEGELSNVNAPASGHVYFTLKDAGAQLGCVCFRSAARRIPFLPQNGMTVIAHGAMTVYDQQGRYQLTVDRLEPSGVGALALAVDQLKRRLAAEGLFDERHKRRLPVLPRRVVVVTSRSGAAFRDVCTVTERRAPGVDVVLSPATVQGEGAADTVALAIRRAGQVRGADVVVLVRGGGSIEDLMPFNSEVVARAIRTCRLPVVTGIGHETDTTVADLAADRRAATPSAAAEMVVPAVRELRREVAQRMLRLRGATRTTVDRVREQLGDRRGRLSSASPGRRLGGHRQEVDARRIRLRSALLQEVSAKRRRLDRAAGGLRAQTPAAAVTAAHERLSRSSQRLAAAGARLSRDRRLELTGRSARLQALSPLRTLERGYSITLDATGSVLTDAAGVQAGTRLRTLLHRGAVESVVAAVDVPLHGEQMYDSRRHEAHQ